MPILAQEVVDVGSHQFFCQDFLGRSATIYAGPGKSLRCLSLVSLLHYYFDHMSSTNG